MRLPKLNNSTTPQLTQTNTQEAQPSNEEKNATTLNDNAVALYGGTFDPIHLGHIEPVKNAAQSLQLNSVALMPCYIPPHKATPITATEHRLAMVKLVCEHEPLFTLDTQEIVRGNQGEPSYTIDTLERLAASDAYRPIFFFIGMDSLVNLHRWHRFTDILQLCNIVVCARPGYVEHCDKRIAKHITNDPKQLKKHPYGCIYIAETQQVDVSSTQIRAALCTKKSHISREHKQALAHLPAYVLSYIRQHHLYSTNMKAQ